MKNSMLILILFIQMIFCDGMFSMVNQNSIYLNFSNFYDNISYINSNSEQDDSVANLRKINFGYVLNGKFDFSIKIINNRILINNFNYPFNKNTYALKFNYFMNNLKKIPLDFSIGYEYVWSDERLFKYNSVHIGSYIDFVVDEYPSVAYLRLSNINNLNLQEYSDSFNIQIGTHIKLVVDKEDNNLLKDIIFLGINLNSNNYKKYYFGIDLGLYHPIG
jgi:hypothetical protein